MDGNGVPCMHKMTLRSFFVVEHLAITSAHVSTCIWTLARVLDIRHAQYDARTQGHTHLEVRAATSGLVGLVLVLLALAI